MAAFKKKLIKTHLEILRNKTPRIQQEKDWSLYVGDEKFTRLMCVKTRKFSNGQVFELMNDKRMKEVK